MALGRVSSIASAQKSRFLINLFKKKKNSSIKQKYAFEVLIFGLYFQVYRWTGENSYFVKGNIDSLQMGGGGCVHVADV